MRTRTLALAFALALLLPPAARATVQCPDSYAQLVGFNSLFAVPGPVLDTTYTTSHAGFDLPAGTVTVSRAVGEAIMPTRHSPHETRLKLAPRRRPRCGSPSNCWARTITRPVWA